VHNRSALAHRYNTIAPRLHILCTPLQHNRSATAHRYSATAPRLHTTTKIHGRSTAAKVQNSKVLDNAKLIGSCFLQMNCFYEKVCLAREREQCWLQLRLPELLAQRGPPSDPLGSHVTAHSAEILPRVKRRLYPIVCSVFSVSIFVDLDQRHRWHRSQFTPSLQPLDFWAYLQAAPQL